VRLGEIGDVDVVAQAGAVGRRVVVAEHLQTRTTGRRRDRPRDDVNLRRVVLADFGVRIGAGRVEVTERDPVDAVGAFVVRQRTSVSFTATSTSAAEPTAILPETCSVVGLSTSKVLGRTGSTHWPSM